MRVAVIGGNLLGCASAFYTRISLDKNRASDTSTEREEDEIVIFEKSSHAGGKKFETLTLHDTEVPIGTARNVDVNSSPVFQKFLDDVGIATPPRKGREEWAIFDWDEDAYKLCQMRSRMLLAMTGNVFVLGFLQLFTLSTAVYFYLKVWDAGWMAFVVKNRRGDYINYLNVLWFAGGIVLGCGIFPMRWLLRFYNWLYFTFTVRAIGGITYGGHSISVLSILITNMKEHLHLIIDQDSATSCITLGHLLSACGMKKYVRVSTSEHMNAHQVHQPLLDDIVSPGLQQAYMNTRVGPGSKTNALATMLNMMSSCPVPTSLRGGAAYLDSGAVEGLCPKVASVARAQIKLGVEVTDVGLVSEGKWELQGSVNGGKTTHLGRFDAVILAAVVDPMRFNLNTGDGRSIEDMLALREELRGRSDDNDHVNAAKYTALVKGKLKSSYVKKSSVDGLGRKTSVLNSVNCSEIVQAGDDLWCVTVGEKPVNGSSVAASLFEEIEEVVWVERERRCYGPEALNVDGAAAPSLVLGTRFINASCVDRIANDVNLDCLSARNTASLFRDGVAAWK